MERGSFLTKYASEIESDPVGDYPRAKACLKDLGFDPEEVSNEDYSSLRYMYMAYCIRYTEVPNY